MKKTILTNLLLIILILCTSCNTPCSHDSVTEATCTSPSICNDCGEEVAPILEHNYVSEITITPTCTEEGSATYTCSLCGDTYVEQLPTVDHIGEVHILEEPTILKNGRSELLCSVCGETIEKTIDHLGSSITSPYVVDAEELYDIMTDMPEDFEQAYVEVTGKVTYISDYDDLIGYYLYGQVGNGLVCWVNNSKLVANLGQTVTFLGLLQNDAISSDQVEIRNSRIQG